MQEVTTHYLEMRSIKDLHASSKPAGAQLQECEVRQYQLNRFLYQWIGEPWQWIDKLVWSDEQWRDYVDIARRQRRADDATLPVAMRLRPPERWRRTGKPLEENHGSTSCSNPHRSTLV